MSLDHSEFCECESGPIRSSPGMSGLGPDVVGALASGSLPLSRSNVLIVSGLGDDGSGVAGFEGSVLAEDEVLGEVVAELFAFVLLEDWELVEDVVGVVLGEIAEPRSAASFAN